MTMIDHSNLIAATEDEQIALNKVGRVLEHINGQPAKLVTADGQEAEIPHPLMQAIQQMIKQLSNGKAVSIVTNDQELDVKEAAELVNISQTFLITLLQDGEIPYKMVGTQYSIRRDDLQKYNKKWNAHMQEGLAEIARLGQEMGEYD